MNLLMSNGNADIEILGRSIDIIFIMFKINGLRCQT